MDQATSAPAAGTSSNPAAGTTANSATGAASSSTAVPSAAVPPPAPGPPPSLLKGKTLDEILVKWNSELDTQTKEFTRMANEVALWDRALMENSEKV